MEKKTIISGLLVLIWLIVIFILSGMDTNESNEKSKSIVNNVVEKVDIITNASDEQIKNHKNSEFIQNANVIFRKCSHATVYFALAILVFNFVIRLWKKNLFFYDIVSLIFCFLYACSDEYHQTFVVGRTGSFVDVLIDTSGALIGILLINLVYVLVRKKVRKKVLA